MNLFASQRPPLRFAVLALALIVPALGLVAVAVWAIRSDRRAAEAELRERADTLAGELLVAIQDTLEVPRPRPVVLTALGSGWGQMGLDADGRLSWPIVAPWPPVPRTLPLAATPEGRATWQAAVAARARGEWDTAATHFGNFVGREGEGSPDSGVWTRAAQDRRSLVAIARLERAHALRAAGKASEAAEAYREALAEGPPDAVTESGLGVGEVALHALLDLVEERPERWPEPWRSEPLRGAMDMLGLRSTPLAETGIARFRTVVSKLFPSRPESSEAARVDEILRPRLLALEAYRSLVDGRSNGGDDARAKDVASRRWRDAMLFYLERRAWLALRDPRPGNEAWVPPVPAVSAAGQSIYALVCWNDAYEHVRRVHRARDPRGVFGVSVEMRGPDFSLQSEEPSGVAARATSTRTEVHATGMALKVALAPVSSETALAPQRRRERVLGGLVVVAAGLAMAAAGVTWSTLVRQHRLGIQKSDFVASVSHELRAPLASVRLLADNLEHDRVADPDRRAATVRWIGRECRRLGALVDNVLDLSRIERGKKRLEPEPTDLAALVRATVASATMSVGERSVAIREAFGPGAEGLVASVDPTALRQALVNLVDNAVKHAPDGTEVVVGLEFRSEARRFELSVSDGGPGVPESDRRKVFEPFVRLGTELRREQAGIGIGLAIVRHIVEAHGGRVWVEPVVPTGARFVVEMPLGPDVSIEVAGGVA